MGDSGHWYQVYSEAPVIIRLQGLFGSYVVNFCHISCHAGVFEGRGGAKVA